MALASYNQRAVWECHDFRGKRWKGRGSSCPSFLTLWRRVHRVLCGMQSGNYCCYFNTNSHRPFFLAMPWTLLDVTSISLSQNKSQGQAVKKKREREFLLQRSQRLSFAEANARRQILHAEAQVAPECSSERLTCTKGYREASGNVQAEWWKSIRLFDAFQANCQLQKMFTLVLLSIEAANWAVAACPPVSPTAVSAKRHPEDRSISTWWRGCSIWNRPTWKHNSAAHCVGFDFSSRIILGNTVNEAELPLRLAEWSCSSRALLSFLEMCETFFCPLTQHSSHLKVYASDLDLKQKLER